MLIYKILRPEEWDVLRNTGEFTGAPIDIDDGFIHLSKAEQVRETAAKHFADAGDLYLIGVETDGLGDELRWEVSRGGALFPHLYRMLRLDDVAFDAPLEIMRGHHVFPPEIP
jgi:uncharacterized protein (DUF952 family)